jgi:hypothetical protein
MITHTPASFSEVMEVIEKFQIANTTSWYRGVGDSGHALTPSIFRHQKRKSIEDIREIENELATIFAQRSPPFVSQVFNNAWEQMFYMQHYGIPTRLLDWTESPFVALYFALTSCERSKQGTPKKDAAIWMLDPIEWNRHALRDISYRGGILDANREQVKSYNPETELEDRKNLPVMIHGIHNSPRIVAQRGMFALFGKSVNPMEVSFAEDRFSNSILQKVIIEKDKRDEIANSLFRKGVSDSTVYPDLYGLALELKRSFGFWK